MPQSARATFKQDYATGCHCCREVSMPQSARATFKRDQGANWDHHFYSFQCLNRHEQPSSGPCPISPIRNGGVSMPQSARATFKPRARGAGATRRLVSMPQSARATFKLVSWAFLPHGYAGFNASIGTSNLQARMGAWSAGLQGCFNASIGTSNLQAGGYSALQKLHVCPFQCLNRHEQPSSTMIASAVCVNSTFQCLNRHEQPSSTASNQNKCRVHLFQCLNRHEQPSSPHGNQGSRLRRRVSMPQSARATFK